MKKFYFCLLCLIIPILVSAQTTNYFLLQSDCTFKTEDGKDYIVINKPNMNQKELFDFIMKNAHQLCVSPKDVISSIDTTSITLFLQSKPTISGAYGVGWFVECSYKIQFKDGRIRIEAPYPTRWVNSSNGASATYLFDWYGFDKIFKNGVPNKNPKFLERYNSINKIVNDVIVRLLQEQNKEW